jgi:hypothetical protein
VKSDPDHPNPRRRDRRRAAVYADLVPDREAIWGRFISFFCRKEGLHPDDFGIQARLAYRVGTVPSTVNRWFRTGSIPDLVTVARFWAAYPTLNLWWLMWGEGPEEVAPGARGTMTAASEREMGRLEAYAITQAELARLAGELQDLRERLPGGPKRLTLADRDVGERAPAAGPHRPPAAPAAPRPTKRRGG